MPVKPLRQIYQLKITLDDFKPEIWRCVLVTNDTNLEKVNAVIQIAMGWQNCHLHQFTQDKERYTITEFEEGFDDMPFNEEREYKLSQLLKKPGDKITYEYDYGDCWIHTVTLEEIKDFDAKTKLPACVAGENACPPEDCGGIWGYAGLLEILKDPQHEEYDRMLEWVGGSFDASKFNRKAANTRLSRDLKEFLFNYSDK